MTTDRAPIPISPSTVVIASENQASSCVGDETVVLDFARGLYYELDMVGTFVWERAQEPVDVASICRAVSESFGVDTEQSERDVLAYLNHLASAGLLTVREGTASSEQALDGETDERR